ncbi:MAG TPA: carboxypeptidase regulatory-like domain-containing protein [Terriglobia bacterium]|nr:carboxypeptidase regulatory-like domain-containing protein [Terriglobia bacterium]
MLKPTHWTFYLSIVAVIAMAAGQLFGQATSGTIFGTVTDSSGAVMPGAKVTVQSVERGARRSVVTNRVGQYTVTHLDLGSYDVSFEAAGFKRVMHPPVTITVKARVEVDAVLQVGSVSQVIRVKGSIPLLKTGSAEVGNVITRQQLQSLPIISRNFLTVATLAPGTNSGDPGGRQAALSGAEIVVGGTPAEGNNFIIDGVSDNMDFSGTAVINPPIDAIQEFAVQTSQYSAEFGDAAGGIVNIALKSGTNQLHGFAYDYLQNDALNATPYDFTGAYPPKPPLRRNQFGAGAGLPLIKDKLFLFGDYDGVREPSSSVDQFTVPTAAEKNGDFSQSGFTIYDPSTAHPNPSNPSQIVRDPFSGNMIPTSRIDAVGASLAGYLPNPNFVSPIPGVLDNYLTTQTDNDSENRFVIKGDALVSPKDTISAHLANQREVRTLSGWLPNNLQAASGGMNGDNAGLNYTRIVSPTFLNQVRLAYNRMTLPQIMLSNQDILGQFNIPGWVSNQGYPKVTTKNISKSKVERPVATFPTPFILVENTYQFLDTVNWQKGRHSIKVGGEIDHIREDLTGGSPGGGKFVFDGSYTTQFVGQSVKSPRTGIADQLLGLANSMGTTYNFDAVRIRSYRFDSFIEDDWRVTPRLTLNLGLRYDFFQPYHEEQDRFGNFDLSTGMKLVPETVRKAVKNTLGLLNGDLPAGWKYVPLNQVIPRDNWKDFGPRLGVTFAVNKHLVLRSGYGIYYDQPDNNTFIAAGGEGNPFNFQLETDAGALNPIVVQNGFPSGGIESVLASNSFNAFYDPIDRPDASAQKYSANIEWVPFINTGIEAGYMGQTTRHFLSGCTGGNQAVQPGPSPLIDRVPYPNVGTLDMMLAGDNSNYNALTVSWTQRETHGLTFYSAFTWSKSMGYDTGAGNPVTRPYDLNYDYGPSDYDMAKVWTSALTYGIPRLTSMPSFARAVLGNWELSGVLTFESGLPFTATDSGAILNVGSISGTGNRPNAVGNPNLPSGQQSIARWFNTSAFVDPPSYTWGNAGKNTLRGPGFANVDFAIQKRIPLFSEHRRLVIRMESTNLFNRVQLGYPNADISDSSFGRIQSLRSGPRALQAALRFEF